MGRTPKGLLSGPKFSNKHSTVITAAEPVIALLRARPEVTKVVLSEIRSIGPGKPHVKATPVPAGLRVVVRGSAARQEFFVYTDDPEATSAAILAVSPSEEA